MEAIEAALQKSTDDTHKECELTEARDTAKNKLPFTIKAECATLCIHSKEMPPVNLSSKFFFSPASHGLHVGDGGLPFRSLTAHLEMDSRMSCLETAAHYCGGLNRIKTAEVKSLSSGTWKAPAFHSCSADETVVKSPYHPAFKLRTRPPKRKWTREAGYQPLPRIEVQGQLTGPQPRTPEQYLQEELQGRVDDKTIGILRNFGAGKIDFASCQEKLSADPENDFSFECETLKRILDLRSRFQDPSTCKNPIPAVSCFGDCMGRDATDPILRSPSPNKTVEVTICGDSLVKAFQSEPFRSASANVKELLCEDFAARSLLKAGDAFPATEGQTCAAYRLRADCRGVR